MIFVSMLFSVLLLGLGLGSVTASPTAKAQCVTLREGPLSTSLFIEESGITTVLKPYYFNSQKFLAYDPTKKHPEIIAQFQNCTPNYAQVIGQKRRGEVYGRMYIPRKKACLFVTNPSGSPPYFISYKKCPSVTEMATRKSIPYNFVWDGSGGPINMRWTGSTSPPKGTLQGPNPPAKYCRGQYYVNATNLEQGHDVPILGQPNAVKSEGYRIHLYCPKTRTGGTSYNSLTLLVNGAAD